MGKIHEIKLLEVRTEILFLTIPKRFMLIKVLRSCEKVMKGELEKLTSINQNTLRKILCKKTNSAKWTR
jgi:hypothetical protein